MEIFDNDREVAVSLNDKNTTVNVVAVKATETDNAHCIIATYVGQQEKTSAEIRLSPQQTLLILKEASNPNFLHALGLDAPLFI